MRPFKIPFLGLLVEMKRFVCIDFLSVILYVPDLYNISTIHQEDSMNKLDLVKALAMEAELTKGEAIKVIDLFFDEMSNALANGDRVEIRGLCSFYVKQYKAYTGRNPKTGEQIEAKSKKLPFFKCGQKLKERVDYQG
jgi:integration host factor subunit beta